MGIETALLQERIKELEKENEFLRSEQIKISEAKELYLKIFEEFPALIWRSRLDKLCDYFNKTWLDFTGRTMEQEFGNGWAEGVHPEDFDFCLKTYVGAFDKREAFLMEYRMKNKFGEYRWIRDFGRPFYDLDNTFLGYIGSCYDITEIKDNESRLEELIVTKDKFFSIIAHDLKDPFNSILGFSEVLIEELKEKDYNNIEKIVGNIFRSSERAMNLLTNLITWSRLESGRMPVRPEYIDMSEIFDEMSLLLESAAEQKKIIIENQLLSDNMVFADKEMISTVVRNLLTNAIKFTKKGGKIRFVSSSKNNELTFAVIDTGVGIAKDRINRLFTLSESDSTTGTQNEKGTGLGLILCKDFIEKNNGKIWVDSNVKIGSTFSFTLPTKPDLKFILKEQNTEVKQNQKTKNESKLRGA